MRDSCIILFGIVPEGKRQHGRNKLRWDDKIKIDLKQREYDGMKCN
jgi:hypothetical protein